MAKLQLTDDKFITQSIERDVARLERIAGRDEEEPYWLDDYSKLQGSFDKRTQKLSASAKPEAKSYEAVYFVEPRSGRHVYGSLVAVDHEGNARIAVGDGTYAVVGPNEVRRFSKESKDEAARQISAVLGQIEAERTDLHVTSEPSDIGRGEYVLSLGFSYNYGEPSEKDLERFARSNYDFKEIVEIDRTMPGRVAMVVGLDPDAEVAVDEILTRELVASDSKEAGMQSGGEVIEELDPEDLPEKEAVIQKKAPEKKSVKSKRAQTSPYHSNSQSAAFAAAASTLAEWLVQKDPAAAKHAIKEFLARGGGDETLVKNSDKYVRPLDLVRMGLEVMKMTSKNDYDRLVQKAAEHPLQVSVSPPQQTQQQTQQQAPAQTQQVPDFGDLQFTDDSAQPARGQTPGVSPLLYQSGPRSQRQGKKKDNWRDKNLPDDVKQSAGDWQQAGKLYESMKLTITSRRGGWVIGKVEFDPKFLPDEMPDRALKMSAESFVHTYTTTYSSVHGAVGGVTVTSLDRKRGVAKIRFFADTGGPLPEEVLEPEDD